MCLAYYMNMNGLALTAWLKQSKRAETVIISVLVHSKEYYVIE